MREWECGEREEGKEREKESLSVRGSERQSVGQETGQ